MNLIKLLRERFQPVLAELAPDSAKLNDYLGMLRVAQNPEHGDYQANFAMPLGKVLSRKPAEVAALVVSKLELGDLLEPPTVAGPGFINIRLRTEFLAEIVRGIAGDDQLGVERAASPRTYLIDYSGPNVAKPLHVGHLRSTIIGDALNRILRFLGHKTIGDNHLGDWGTQFGILLYGFKHHRDKEAFAADPIRELARIYVLVRKLFVKKSDEDDDDPVDDPVKRACQQETAKLHSGDAENLALWEKVIPACLAMLQPIYDRLEVKIDHALGESFYHSMLPGVVEDMLAKGIAFESKGAVVIPNAAGNIPQSKEEQKKEDPPALIRKSDGAFTYTTSDLATIKYRVDNFHPDAMVYVVDARQALHFRTLFAQARRWGYSHIEMSHVSFGSMLGADSKPLETRKGGNVELETLLDEAASEGLRKYEQQREERISRGEDVPELTPEQRAEIAEVVGIGAVKYADLSQNRTSDYIFNYDKMLATDGNTASYMQYAYVRCRGIFRKGEIDEARFRSNPPVVKLGTPYERNLALQLLRFQNAVEDAASEYLPHYLTAYLWDLAKVYSQFFVNCPVLKAETADLRDSRLLLCDLTARVIQKTLSLLGIKTIERM